MVAPGLGTWSGAYPEFLKTEVLCLPKEEEKPKANFRGLVVGMSAASKILAQPEQLTLTSDAVEVLPPPWL